MTILMVFPVAVLLIATIVLIFKLKKSIEISNKLKEDKEEIQELLKNTKYIVERENQAILATFKDKELRKIKENFNKENTNVISQATYKSTIEDLSKSIKDKNKKVFKNMSQNLLGNIDDVCSKISLDLQFDLFQKIWDSFQNYKSLNIDSPVILPKNTKALYTKGNRTIMIIEQEPQVRSVTFDYFLLDKEERLSCKNPDDFNGYTFSLSFPYIYFILAFDNGQYRYHELYFKNTPLSSTRDYVNLAPLPNIYDRNGNFINCVGKQFETDMKIMSIAEQSDYVIGHFWQSTFTKDLGLGTYKNIDAIKSIKKWQENTELDPLFVLKLKWEKDKTVKGIIERLLDLRDKKSNLDPLENKIKTMLSESIENISKNIKKELKDSEKNNFSSTDIDLDLDKKLKNLFLDHSGKVFDSCSQL